MVQVVQYFIENWLRYECYNGGIIIFICVCRIILFSFFVNWQFFGGIFSGVHLKWNGKSFIWLETQSMWLSQKSRDRKNALRYLNYLTIDDCISTSCQDQKASNEFVYLYRYFYDSSCMVPVSCDGMKK